MAQEKIYEVELTREELEIITVALTDRVNITRRLAAICQEKGVSCVDILNSHFQLVIKIEEILNNI